MMVVFCAWSSVSAFDGFVLLQGIPGESTDTRHRDWIDITSFSQSVVKSSGAPQFSEFSFAKNQDKSSPQLFLRAANGMPVPRATLELTQTSVDQKRFYQVVLSNCVVRAARVSGASNGSDKPMEQVGLSYNWISWTYSQIRPDGTSAGDTATFWDVVRGTGHEPFRLTGVKEGTNIVVSWLGKSGATYRLSGSPNITGQYSLVQSFTATSNGMIRLTFPIRAGNLFYVADTSY